jgi:hypothetical protein
MTAKSVVGFLLGLALASGIWGTIFIHEGFVALIVGSGILVLIFGVIALANNWE